jgi:hypothetical protein
MVKATINKFAAPFVPRPTRKYLAFRMKILYSCFTTFSQIFASLEDRQYIKEFGTYFLHVAESFLRS